MGIFDVLKSIFTKEKDLEIEEELRPIKRVNSNSKNSQLVNVKSEIITKSHKNYVSSEGNYYTFKNVDPQKTRDIKKELSDCANKSLDLSTFLLRLYARSFVFDYEYRHIIYDFISTYNSTDLSTKESLAVGLALSQKWAENALEAAEKIEFYIENKAITDEQYVESLAGPTCNDHYLTISLYKLFEKGKDIDRAIKWAEKLNGKTCSFIMDISRLYSKKDIRAAIDYMESVKEQYPSIYNDNDFQKQLTDYKRKAEKNYKYRPRKAKVETDQEKEMKQNIRIKALELREYAKSELGY